MDFVRVLVAGDDAPTRRAIIGALNAAGILPDVIEHDGSDTILDLLRQPLDCVLLDSVLSGRTGLDLLRLMRRKEISTPVILLTAQQDESLIIQALRAGVTDCLPRSQLSPETLALSLRRALSVQEANRRAADAREQLRANQERLTRVVETMADGVLIFDLAGHYTFLNAAAERILGISASRVLGANYRQVPWRRIRTDGSDLPNQEHLHARVMATGLSIATDEVGLVRTDGTTVWVSLSASPLRNAAGNIEGVVVTLRDVTDAKAATQALRESEERFSKVFHSSPTPILLTEMKTGRILDVNDAFVHKFLWRRDQLVGRTTLEMGIWPTPDHRAEMLRRLTGQPAMKTFETQFRDRDGLVHDLLASVESFDLQGIRCVLAMGQDITERNRAEAALRRSQQWLTAIINASPLGICSIDTEGRILLWNPASRRIFGWSDDEVLGRPLPFVFPNDQEQHAELCRRVFSGERIMGLELACRRRDGASIFISISTAPIGDDADRIVAIMFVMEDITAARQLKEQLLQSHRMESVGRLAGGIAHDFNNLLAVISGYSESLLRRLDEHDPLYPACAEIQAAADRGASLTRQLLAFSRSQAIQPRDVDLNRVVANVCRMLRRVISDKIDIRLESHAPDAIVRADDGQLEQVLMNLALNARDAMPNGGRLTIRIEPPAADAPNGGFVRLIVRDTGCGMEPELRSRIFEPFFTTKEGKGTGLGLSIVYGIVQQFGGRILVESELGKGSTFEILLPSVA